MQLTRLLRIPQALPTTFLNTIARIGVVYKSRNFSVCNSRQLPVTSSVLAQNSTQTAGHNAHYEAGGPRLVGCSRMFFAATPFLPTRRVAAITMNKYSRTADKA